MENNGLSIFRPPVTPDQSFQARRLVSGSWVSLRLEVWAPNMDP